MSTNNFGPREELHEDEEVEPTSNSRVVTVFGTGGSVAPQDRQVYEPTAEELERVRRALTHEVEESDVTRGCEQLLKMLTYKRPAFSETEEEFIDEFIVPLDPWFDEYGNAWVQVGDDPKILWSSHTDTVHHSPGRQLVSVRQDVASVVFIKSKNPEEKTNCLGADCAAGVWLMVEMIRAGVAGLYVFHRNEENGGVGSRWIANNVPQLLEGIEFAVAFDRKGYDSVITHQGSRTCSDAFARSMAQVLGGSYKPDDTGLFTDTAQYTDLIGECSNVSVGYHNAHGPAEILDLQFIVELRDKLVRADFSSLVSERVPGEQEIRHWSTHGGYGGAYGQSDWFHEWRDKWDGQPSSDQGPTSSNDEDLGWPRSRWSTLIRYVLDNPDVVVDFLESMGVSVEDLEKWGSSGQ